METIHFLDRKRIVLLTIIDSTYIVQGLFYSVQSRTVFLYMKFVLSFENTP